MDTVLLSMNYLKSPQKNNLTVNKPRFFIFNAKVPHESGKFYPSSNCETGCPQVALEPESFCLSTLILREATIEDQCLHTSNFTSSSISYIQREFYDTANSLLQCHSRWYFFVSELLCKKISSPRMASNFLVVIIRYILQFGYPKNTCTPLSDDK